MELKKIIAAAAALVALCGSASAAEISYRAEHDASNFRYNQDSIRYEAPDSGAFRISPRLKNTDVWTRFAVPSDQAKLTEWRATAHIRGSDGPAVGVALVGAEASISLIVFPDGRGALRTHEGRRVAQETEFTITGMTFPAAAMIWRDGNGSAVAVINDAIVASIVSGADFSSPKTFDVEAAAFVTVSDGSSSDRASAFYEKLTVEAGGRPRAIKQETSKKDDLFEQLREELRKQDEQR